MAQLNYEGRFKLRVLSWGLKTFDSGSAAVDLRCSVMAEYRPDATEYVVDADGWMGWEANGFEVTEVEGLVFLLGKNGKELPDNGEEVIAALGWNGSFTHFGEACPVVEVQGVVKANEYKGNVSYQIDRVYPVDASVGRPTASADKLAELDAKHGQTFRALRSMVAPSAPLAAPASKPEPTPAPAPTPAPGASDKVDEFGTVEFKPARPSPVPTPPAPEWDPDKHAM